MGENTIITGNGNVFADIGLPDADERLLKARMAKIIADTIADLGITQTTAAKRLRIAQPDVSNLLRGRLSGFSLERLFGFASKLGNDIEIKVKKAPARAKRREGHIRMLAA
jgi:predicted XRE-type DNA-binding protein